jgi:hypothetical protein
MREKVVEAAAAAEDAHELTRSNARSSRADGVSAPSRKPFNRNTTAAVPTAAGKRPRTAVRESPARSDSKPTAPSSGLDVRLPSQVTDEPWIWADIELAADVPADDDNAGKWLVFVPTAAVDAAWAAIRDATFAGQLGDVVKVATRFPSPLRRVPGEHVICVYTRDFTDKADVTRVLIGLRELGFTQRLSYKTDAATYAGRYGRTAGRVASYVSPPGATWFDER